MSDTSQSSKMREEFEAAAPALFDGQIIRGQYGSLLDRDSHFKDEYKFSDVNLAWRIFETGWIARGKQWETPLAELKAWLQHQLAVNVIHRSTGKGGHDGDGTSWSAVAIPEWDVRQKLDMIDVSLPAAPMETGKR